MIYKLIHQILKKDIEIEIDFKDIKKASDINETHDEFVQLFYLFINIQDDEKLKIHILTALIGVKYPSASAILMFIDRNYPVLDIRVWKQLYNLNYVNSNPNGQNFTLEEWNTLLGTLQSEIF